MANYFSKNSINVSIKANNLTQVEKLILVNKYDTATIITNVEVYDALMIYVAKYIAMVKAEKMTSFNQLTFLAGKLIEANYNKKEDLDNYHITLDYIELYYLGVILLDIRSLVLEPDTLGFMLEFMLELNLFMLSMNVVIPVPAFSSDDNN
jgi:hypothetical protein